MNDQKRPGDSGRSGTRNRRDIPKDSPIFELLGALEECEGQLAAARLKAPEAVAPVLEELEGNMKALFAEISGGPRFATAGRIEQLEKALAPLAEAAGEQASAQPPVSEGGAGVYLARAVVRRAERKAVAMAAVGGVSREVIAYLNRLSRLLGALASLCDQSETAPSAKGRFSPAALDGQGLCAEATALCARVIEYARAQNLRVVAAVCDAGGNLVCLMRDDEALLASIDVAMGKAYTSASLKMDTQKLGQLAQPGGALYGVQHTNQGKIVVLGGGVPLFSQGRLIGALGVSGGTPQEDAAVAQWGAENF